MNREIKFRAVDKETNEIYDGERIETDDSIIVTLSYGQLVGFYVGIGGDYEELILNQSTGMTDKNGVEIYEGDILGKGGHWSFYIGFKDACFVMIPCDSVQRVNWTWLPIGQNMIEGWEIIGNIYKNQELLTS